MFRESEHHPKRCHLFAANSHYFLNLLLESIASPVQIPNYLDLDSEVNILDYIGRDNEQGDPIHVPRLSALTPGRMDRLGSMANTLIHTQQINILSGGEFTRRAP
eukprot:sb/3477958/